MCVCVCARVCSCVCMYVLVGNFYLSLVVVRMLFEVRKLYVTPFVVVGKHSLDSLSMRYIKVGVLNKSETC